MNDIIDLTFLQVALAYVFVLIVLAIVRIRGIRREKEIVISSIRMTLQLVLVGYVLVYVFDNPSPYITGAIIIVMAAFAIHTIFRKFRTRLTGPLRRVIAFSMCFGTLTCIAYFLLVVVRITPWYDPQYFIPIAGMIIGNSMTGISLGVKSLLDGMTTQKHLVEEALILGATPKAATRDIVNSTFDSAIMPTINSMVGMGIVFLPGMMTGQILSGTDPTTAIAYQIAIMLGILGAVALSIITMLQLGYRTFFNKEDQLR
ncbi:putative ABC transport system permease protein [Desulfonatronum thiosulfatophilum]|uniref:Putative ABC transport system permease protein n=1 Tax=Desulfonatronum thiosulfatophilum TaxID=617002 RepID=A0A1G6EE96_9BACT|nr:iron export ABC transporter permease subunit FetB [Desulfonatronum thiosulfatophilum]SDB55751.1 putative ABC transport system permease protein [Desulfonatronum thiosulfatophilum]